MSTAAPDHHGEEKIVIKLPDGNEAMSQDEEWCEVVVGDGRIHEKVRFHDYGRIYEIPGFYESLFYETLRCNSPKVVGGLLRDKVQESAGMDPDDLRVLELGAGNGLAGEELRDMGAELLVGVDILEEASAAAERDRPGLYDDYRVSDFTALEEKDEEDLRAYGFNTLVSVAALGFDDIPAEAFATAWNLVGAGGWVAFNIKDEFLGSADRSGFRRLIDRMTAEGILSPQARQRYRHRLSIRGEPLHYIAVVARKRGDVPADWLADA
jgi:SAM-dependent methyltransferase